VIFLRTIGEALRVSYCSRQHVLEQHGVVDAIGALGGGLRDAGGYSVVSGERIQVMVVKLLRASLPR